MGSCLRKWIAPHLAIASDSKEPLCVGMTALCCDLRQGKRTREYTVKYGSMASPRVRFNWGFWDGRSGAWDGRSTAGHFDKVYAEGVAYGKKSKDVATETSDPAWEQYRNR